MALIPVRLLKEATKEYPAICAVWGALAIIAVTAVVATFSLGYAVLIVGFVVIAMMMAGILVFAVLTKKSSPGPLRFAGYLLAYICTLIVCAIAVIMVPVTFFGFPNTWNEILGQNFAGFSVQGGTVFRPSPPNVYHVKPLQPKTLCIPQLKNGDRDFQAEPNNPMDVTVKTYGHNNGRTFVASIYLYAEEEGNDKSTVEGECLETLYIAPPEYRIINVRPEGPSFLSTSITKPGDILYPRGEGEIAKNFIIYGDKDGDDPRIYTRVDVEWHELEIILGKR